MKKNIFLVVTFSVMLISLSFFSYHFQIDRLKQDFIKNKKNDALQVSNAMATQFKYIHQLIKSIAMFPSIKNIERHAKNFTEDNRNSLRQLYRYAFLNVALSEIYIVPKSLNPEKIDPVTQKSEEPILMFDDFIVKKEVEKKEEEKKEENKLEQVEIEEYRLLKSQLEFFNTKFPKLSSTSPVLSGKEVITCDNSEFTLEQFKKGDDTSRKGLVISTPFYDDRNNFNGAVTAVVRTDVLRRIMPEKNYLLMHGKDISISNKPSSELLNFISGKKINIIYSEEIKVNIPDEAGEWHLYSVANASDFFNSPEVISVRQIHAVFGVIILIAGIISGYSLYKASKRKIAVESLSKKVNDSIKQLKDSASLLQDISSDLSSETNEQASSIQQTSSSLIEIDSMIKSTSEATQKIVESAKDNLNFIDKGQGVINFLKSSIDDISVVNHELADQVNYSNNEVAKIISIIQEIEDKTKIINDIVFQTKLLSFNASVEAARAGELGKGFAVVAEEVGNLAAMSGNAAYEISEILNKSTQAISRIIDNSKSGYKVTIEKINHKIDNGTNAVRECEKVFSEILKNIDHSSTLVSEISIATKDQATGVSEISAAVSQLDNSTSSVAATAASTANSSTLLAGEIIKLEELAKDLNNLLKN